MIVAEISANHCGKLSTAIKLIEAAAWAGADAVKLQTYTPECITIESNAPEFVIQDGPWRGRTLHELYKEGSTPWEWHASLFAEAKKRGLKCFSSPFSLQAVDFLRQFDPPFYKVASFEITDLRLIRACAEQGKPVIMSTGCATREDLIHATAITGPLTNLLHCVSDYPADASKYSLRRITELQLSFCCSVGLSDHTTSLDLPAHATTLGAHIIEKHITLGRGMGLDAAFSLVPEEFRMMVDRIKKSRAFTADNSSLSSPMMNLRRSLYVVADIAQGEEFTHDNVRAIRPGHGMHPLYLDDIIGKRCRANVKRGTPMILEMVA